MGFAGILRQSTAVDVLIGPFVDSADGDSEESGLTIAQADVRLSKNGQTAAQKNDNTTCAHDADGFYNCELDATDTNTVGQLTLYVHVSGALCVRHDFQVLEENVYDAWCAASAAAGTDLAAILADTGTDGVVVAAGSKSGYSLAADQAGVTVGTVNALGTQAKADVGAEVDTALSDYDAVVPGDLPTNFADLAITSSTGRMTVGTNADKTGYSLAADQSGVTIGTVNALAAGAVAAASLAAAACAKVADVVLRRTFANARGSSDGDSVSFRSLLGAVAKLVNRIDTTTHAGKLTTFAEDDSTELGTQTLTTDSGAEPIIAADTDA